MDFLQPFKIPAKAPFLSYVCVFFFLFVLQQRLLLFFYCCVFFRSLEIAVQREI